MTEPWPSDQPIDALDDLLGALDCDDLDDLAAYVEEHLVDVGDLWWNWYSEDAVVCDLGNDYVGHVAFEVLIPTTIAAFHESLETLSQRMEYRLATAGLPTEDDREEEGDAGSTAPALAAFFDVEIHTFVAALGEDWRPVNGSRLVGENDYALRWFGAGEPLRVLLGVGEDYATLAKPILGDDASDGAELLDGKFQTDVALRSAATLDRLAEKLPRFLEMTEGDGRVGAPGDEQGDE